MTETSMKKFNILKLPIIPRIVWDLEAGFVELVEVYAKIFYNRQLKIKY